MRRAIALLVMVAALVGAAGGLRYRGTFTVQSAREFAHYERSFPLAALINEIAPHYGDRFASMWPAGESGTTPNVVVAVKDATPDDRRFLDSTMTAHGVDPRRVELRSQQYSQAELIALTDRAEPVMIAHANSWTSMGPDFTINMVRVEVKDHAAFFRRLLAARLPAGSFVVETFDKNSVSVARLHHRHGAHGN
jgi:hypothetical protein